jgi:hypothetical protein
VTPEVQNYIKYAAVALGAFLVGCAAALVPQLLDPALPPINWRIVIGTGISALVTAYGSTLLPRAGSTGLATQVNHLRDLGVPRAEMTVVPSEDLEHLKSAAAGQPEIPKGLDF